MSYQDDVKIAKRLLAKLPTKWDGKASVLEMKEADFNWRQMEWWGFYFELLCYRQLAGEFSIPGDKYGSAATSCFDLKRSINWDLKAKAIKSDDHRSILNDTEAMDWSVEKYGVHGLMVGLCDVEYNDKNRSFQRWHEELKGGKSKYQLEREKRTSVSRYRKTSAELQEILFLVVTPENISLLGIHHQGRNSNGKPRPPKYMLDYDEEILSQFLVDRIVFDETGG
ncbi:MAG: hypothetical protein HRF47_11550 [Chloroflexota bacterium]|jgi:hypothetical protein